MKASDLLALRSGRTDFGRFVRAEARYFDSMSTYFAQRLTRVSAPVDRDDLRQIAISTLWEAVGDYRYRCPACPRATPDEGAFARHTERRHGSALDPRPDLLRYVHGRVGRALDHETRRYVRRRRFGSDLEIDTAAAYFEPVPPTQEEAAEFHRLVERATRELDPVAREVLDALALGRPIGSRGRRIRDDLRDGFLRRYAG